MCSLEASYFVQDELFLAKKSILRWAILLKWAFFLQTHWSVVKCATVFIGEPCYLEKTKIFDRAIS